MYSLASSIVQIARQVELFHCCQREPNLFKVCSRFNLAEPEEQKESNSIAEILESLRNVQTQQLDMNYRYKKCFINDLNVDSFRQLRAWHQSLYSLHLNHFRVNVVDSETFFHFRHLRSLFLVDLGITDIRSDAFKGLGVLTTLNLGFNCLEILENGTFESLPNLENLYLTGNKLKSLPSGLFHNLKKLEELCLGLNPLNVNLHEDTFCGLENLRKLDLTHTPLALVINQESPIIRKHMKHVAVELA
jgi:hypothetical protein